MAIENSTALTPERLREVVHYEPETGEFRRIESRRQRSLGLITPKPMPSGHLRIQIDGKRYLAHRLAWLYVHGSLPDVLDHINGDPKDNRIANLRPASNSENARNSRGRSHSTSGVRNVQWARRKRDIFAWRATVTHDGKCYRKWFGSDKMALGEAKEWAESLRKRLHGDFFYGA